MTTWFQKRALPVRRTEWSQAAKVAEQVASQDDGEAEEPVSGTAAVVPVAALEASEQALALKIAELARAEGRLTTLRDEMLMAQAAATDAREALAVLASKTLAAAETELVKLALAIAERVVARE